MLFTYFYPPLFIVLVAINWLTHFVVNHRKRKKKGIPFELNGERLIKELVSFVVVLVISFAETILLYFLYSLL